MKLFRILVAAAVVAAVGFAVSGSAASGAIAPRLANKAQTGPFHIRVLVLSMFGGATFGETQPWLQNEKLPKTFSVKGAFSPVHCNAAGLCVTTIGEGKSNAGASVVAILDDPQFNFSNAYFMTAGIAGTPPSVGTLGFAAWARYVVDFDLGHHLVPSQASDYPFGYIAPGSGYAESFTLNASLAETAYRVTRNVALADSAEADKTRAKYSGQAGKKPFVALCDTVAGDDYWAGATLSAEGQYIMTANTDGKGTYCTTEQEDSAVAEALSRFGFLSRYLDLRTASNFDQPYPGETVEQLLQTFPGYTIAVENAYRVGSTMANYLMTH